MMIHAFGKCPYLCNDKSEGWRMGIFFNTQHQLGTAPGTSARQFCCALVFALATTVSTAQAQETTPQTTPQLSTMPETPGFQPPAVDALPA
ncbi:hypothetical protein R0J90_13870, partial [Micrococcus sp. SIMBA_144]